MQLLNKTKADVRKAAKMLGLSESVVMKKAVENYLESANEEVALQRELHAWQSLSVASIRKNEL
jgi:hypothetical protein